MIKKYAEIPDYELWTLFLRGDKAALSYIYKNQYHYLLSYGMKLHPDYELIRDCIQDLFIKIQLNHEHLSPTSNINTYLIKALKNKIYDTLSSKIEITDINSLPFDFSIDEPFLNIPQDNDSDLLKKNILKKALTQLTSKQKEILYLHFVRELNHKEIGEILDINYQSAKNLLFRTIIKLRTIYFSKD